MKKVIDNWKLNKSLLASKMSISNVVFCKKLKDDTFTELEVMRLKMVLKELYIDLNNLKKEKKIEEIYIKKDEIKNNEEKIDDKKEELKLASLTPKI